MNKAVAENFVDSDNKQDILYKLFNHKTNITATFCNYGARLVGLWVPDKNGQLDDITLGCDSTSAYQTPQTGYFGCATGRVAGRIGKGQFSLDGSSYQLDINNGPNHLHGGLEGWSKVMWGLHELVESEEPSVTFVLNSEDGDQKYPGSVKAFTKYTQKNDNSLEIIMNVKEISKPTIINVCNHAFYNLNGHNKGTIQNHYVKLNCSAYTPTDVNLVPTGEIKKCDKNDFATGHMDLREGGLMKECFERMKNNNPEHYKISNGGYDFNFCNENMECGKVKTVATVFESNSGRVMKVSTNMPGTVFYTGNWVGENLSGKSGALYGKYSGLCLECQYWPDSINHPEWGSKSNIVFRPGDEFQNVTKLTFSTSDGPIESL